jgi:hypothetical protein
MIYPDGAVRESPVVIRRRRLRAARKREEVTHVAVAVSEDIQAGISRDGSLRGYRCLAKRGERHEKQNALAHVFLHSCVEEDIDFGFPIVQKPAGRALSTGPVRHVHLISESLSRITDDQ